MLSPDQIIIDHTRQYSWQVQAVRGSVNLYNFKDVGEEKRLKYDKDQLLGSGSNGTKVYLGTFRNAVTNIEELVAIKRIQYDSTNEYRDIMHEITALQNLVHSHVIRYLFADKIDDHNLMFIALELCRGSLINVVEKRQDVFKKPFVLKASYVDNWWFKKHLLLGVARGLDYIHGQNHVHRDLKPQNILVLDDNRSDYGLKAVICDFELSRKIKAGQSKLSVSQGIVGTQGWMAREILVGAKKIGQSVDVFAFGCITQFVMSDDRNKPYTHPFGADLHRDNAIISGNRFSYVTQSINLDESSDDSYSSDDGSDIRLYRSTYLGDAILADMLVDACISSNKSLRPLASEILQHPFFWSYETKIQCVERMFNDYKDWQYADLILDMEKLWSSVRRRSYSTMIPEAWEYYIYNRETTNRKRCAPHVYSTIFNCLMRMIRNIQQHWWEAIAQFPELDALGDGDDESLGRYFFERIPMSFPVIYTFYQWQYRSGKSSHQELLILLLSQGTLTALCDSLEQY